MSSAPSSSKGAGSKGLDAAAVRQIVQQMDDEFDRNREALLDEFFTFLKFQSISSEPQFAPHVLECAGWLQTKLTEIGFQVELWPTDGHPVLFAWWNGAGPDADTVLIYNHYDVQPVDPLELWSSPPFEPTIRDGEIYARGAQDNKGQCFYVLAALRALIARNGALPLNVKLCIEGEEETGSHGLTTLLAQKREKLSADHLLVMDLGFHGPDSPAVTLGVRGITTMHIEMTGSRGDLHSGTHGGIVYNPNRAMTEVLASLHDSDGRVTVPGFYDDVLPVPQDELARYDLSFDEQGFSQIFGAAPTGGEKKFSPLESAWIRPTVEINGIGGGYTGDGFKTVIPAKTIAKVSCRMVPNQDPAKIAQLVKRAIEERTPQGINTTVTINPGSGPALRSSPGSDVVASSARAYEAIYGAPCHFILSGGSIPVIPALAGASGAEVAMLGFGLPTDNIHAPNEHFGVDRLKKGFALIGVLLSLLGKKG